MKKHRMLTRLLATSCIISIAAAASAQTVYTVQLGSFESEKQAKDHWNRLLEKFPDIFDPLKYSPAEIQLPPDDVVYFRTQAGPISSREEAEGICDNLQSRNFECYVAETAMFSGEDVAAKPAKTPEQISAPASPPPALEKVAEAPKPVETKVAAAPSAAPKPLPPLPKPTGVVPPKADEKLPDIEELELQFADSPPPPPPPPAPVKTAEAPKALPPLPAPSAAAPPPPPPPQPVATAQANVPPPPPPAAGAMPWQSAPSAGPQSTGTPFQMGQSNYAGSPRIPMGAPYQPTPPANVSEPVISGVSDQPITPSESDKAQVKVAEAIPVPLSGGGEAVGSNSAYTRGYTGGFRGYPSQGSTSNSLWAEISYFTTQQAALGYWNTLRHRDPSIPGGLRLRVTRPLMQRGNDHLSLRIGPFSNVQAIQRLCSFTREEKVACNAIKDLGTSVSAYAKRERRQPGTYQAGSTRYGNVQPSPFGGVSGMYAQLGAFPSAEAAHTRWSELLARHGSTLAKQPMSVVTPNYTSSWSNVYRLRVGPFTQAYDAISLCNQLKGGGTPCAVVGN